MDAAVGPRASAIYNSAMPKSRPEQEEPRWLLLIHQIPPKPDYLRVKIGRRLARVGAVAIKNSVYVLPASEQTIEDFQWVLREIVAGGGEASICRATFVDGLTDAEVERLFHEARARDYEEIVADARAALKSLSGRKLAAERRATGADALARLRKRFAAVTRIDFYPTRHLEEAAELLRQLDARLHPPEEARPSATSAIAHLAPRGRTWVTRAGIFVDRIASAWLIRRFVDPEALFRFLAPHEQRGYEPEPGELRFDMFDAEYTHEGDRCTFETLLRRFALDDPALAQIAEIVHDIDLKDGKFDREDAAGIERVLASIAARNPEDAVRLERGAALFDDLYALAAKEAVRSTAEKRSTARRRAPG